MWGIVLFDLPTETHDECKRYADFRGFLLDDGYTMMQYSVYLRHCASNENAEVHVKWVNAELPADGGSAHRQNHRQTIRQDRGFLWPQTTTNRKNARTIGAFLN